MTNWISVDDRLPTETGFVITWDGEYVDKSWYWSDGDKGFDDGCNAAEFRVAKWMPLPESPE